MNKFKLSLALIFILATAYTYADSLQPRWVSLSTDSRDTVREIIRSEVENREGFSTRSEEKANLKAVEDEKEREDADYKKCNCRRQQGIYPRQEKTGRYYNTVSMQLPPSWTNPPKASRQSAPPTKNLGRTDLSLSNKTSRLRKIPLNDGSNRKKQGEALAAVIYTRGFKDSVHNLENAADKASAPLIAQHMGTYIQSFTRVFNNITTIDFIRATEEGTAKWNNEVPLRIELEKNAKGTTYLRLKRYELYPFQDSKSGKIDPVAPSEKYKVAILSSRKDLETFLTQNQFNPNNYELQRVDNIIRDTNQNNFTAQEGLNEQVKSFQERIDHLQKMIKTAKDEKENQQLLLKRKEDANYKLSLDVASIRDKKDMAERQFHETQTALQEKKRTHESIIIKTALATTKGSQTPAEASAEAVLDKLAEVKNDAKTQHSSSTTEVTNFQVTSETSTQGITEARIIAVRLISFVNEGESVRVNMAFRVRTVLEDQEEPEPLRKKPIYSEKIKEPVFKSDAPPETRPKPLPPTPQETVIALPFQRDYHPLATTNALGCVFDLRNVQQINNNIHILIEVINTSTDARSVAFYDENFGGWHKSLIYDETNKYYPTSRAYLVQGNKKTLMYNIDRRGRGVSIQPQTSITMELTFINIPANIRTIKINLHPFIYYKRGWLPTWQEFDLAIPNIQLYNKTQSMKSLPASKAAAPVPVKTKSGKKKSARQQ